MTRFRRFLRIQQSSLNGMLAVCGQLPEVFTYLVQSAELDVIVSESIRDDRHTLRSRCGRVCPGSVFFARGSIAPSVHDRTVVKTAGRCVESGVWYRGRSGGVAYHPTHPTHRYGGCSVSVITLTPPCRWGKWSWGCSS